jgi:hypothetical protein
VLTHFSRRRVHLVRSIYCGYAQQGTVPGGVRWRPRWLKLLGLFFLLWVKALLLSYANDDDDKST